MVEVQNSILFLMTFTEAVEISGSLLGWGDSGTKHQMTII